MRFGGVVSTCTDLISDCNFQLKCSPTLFKEPQLSSARCRYSLFTAISRLTEGKYPPGIDPSLVWAWTFVDKFQHHSIIPLVEAIIGQWSDDILPLSVKEMIHNTAVEAWAWHRNVQMNITSLDFEMFFCEPSDDFDPASMLFFEKHKPNTDPPRLIASIGLGLLSSKSTGDGRELLRVCHEKTDVLTEGFNFF